MSVRAVLAALVLAGPLLVAPLGRGVPIAVAQGEGAGIVDEGSYESPLYGYEVTWRAPWAADPAQTRSGVGGSDSDLLTLGERGGDRAIRIEGFVDESGLADPLADRVYVETLLDLFTAAFESTCVAPACEATVVASEPAASPPTLTYDLAFRGGVVRAITSLATAETAAGWIVFAETLVTLPDDLAAALAEVQASVTVDGRPALAGVELADGGGTPLASPVAVAATAGALGASGAEARR